MGHAVMILSGLTAALLIWTLETRGRDLVEVAVAAKDIGTGERIVAGESYRFTRVPASTDILDALLTRSRIARFSGWVAVAPIMKGEPITPSRLRKPVLGGAAEGPDGQVPVQLVEYPVSVEGGQAPASVSPGDRVDVIAANRDGIAGHVVVGVLVVDVESGGAGLGSKVSVGGRYTLTVAVTRQEANELSAALAGGNRVTVTRSTGVPPSADLPRYQPAPPGGG